MRGITPAMVRRVLRTAHPVVAYTAAVLLAALAQIVRWPLNPPTIIPFITYVPFIALSAAFGGLGPGLLTTLLALLEADWFAEDPVGSLVIANRTEVPGLIALAISGVVVSYLFERAKKTQRIEEAREELAALLDRTYDAAFVWIPGKAGIQWWNDAAERLYLYPRAEALGKVSHHLLATVFPGDSRALETALCEQGSWEGELTHTTRDGRRVTVESRQTARRGADGELRVLEVNRDITERKRTEEALQTEAEFRAMALDAGELGAWDYRFQTNELLSDDRRRLIYGFSASERVTREEFLARIHPDDRLARDEAEQRAVSGDGSGKYHADYRVLWPDGGVRWVESQGRVWFANTGGNKQPVRFLGVSRDITERKRAEQALEEAHAELRAIHEAAPVTLLVVDDHLRVRRVSDLVSLPGRGAAGSEGQLQPGDAIGCLNALTSSQGCGHGNTCGSCVLRRTVKDCLAGNAQCGPAEAWIPLMVEDQKEQRCLLISATPIKFGDTRRALVCAQDISPLRKAEGELLQQRQTLLRQGELINLSHDAIITTDENGAIIGWNAGAEEMYGWTEKEVAGKVIHQLLQTRNNLTTAAIDEFTSRLGSWDGELIHTARDGREIVVESRQVFVPNPGGDSRVLLEINRDVTDRNRAMREAVEANRRTSIILESISDGFATFDSEWRHTYVNPAAAALLGRSAEELVGRNLWELWPYLSTTPFGTACRQAMEQRVATQAEAFCAEPLNVWFELRCYPSGDGIAVFFRNVTIRKQAEESLRQREQNLRRFTETAPVAIAMFDCEMRYLAASTRFLDDFRLGPREVAGRSHYEIFPEIPEHWREAYRRCLAGATERSDGEPLIRSDGSEQWIRWEIQPWRQEDGNIGGIVLFSEDITRQKRAERDVRESEAQFRTLANTIPQLSWMADANGWTFWYNQRWYDYTGTTAEQMEGWGWQSVHNPQMLPAVLDRWKNSIATGEPFEMVFPLRAVDGSFHPFLTRVMPVRDDSGEVVRWFGTSTDITDQRRTEEALRKSEQRFRRIFENALTGIVISDWDGRLEHCNPAICRLLGYTEAELRGIWFGSLLAPEDRAAVLADTDRLRSGAISFFQTESRFVRKDNRQVWVEMFVSVLPDESGRSPHVVLLAADITERRRAEQEILRLNSELEQRVRERTAQLEASNKELEAFAYSVSHDLRAPLRGIDGWSLALLEDYGEQLNGEARRYLTRVRSETQRMGQLIDDLLKLSRLTRTEMKSECVDLTKLARAVGEKLRGRHPEREVEFAIQPDLFVIGDASLLEVALTNLLGNAVKFTGTRDRARVEFGQTEVGKTRTFYVRDNGVGFDMAYADMLFGAFQRLHKDSEFPGTGIGLATVQRVIRRHGGRVWAEARPNEGATFYFVVDSKEAC